MQSKVVNRTVADKKAAELLRRAEALRANLRRRKATGRSASASDTDARPASDDETRG